VSPPIAFDALNHMRAIVAAGIAREGAELSTREDS